MSINTGYNPNVSLLPEGNGIIMAMSGGGNYDPNASLLPNNTGGQITAYSGGSYKKRVLRIGGQGETPFNNVSNVTEVEGQSKETEEQPKEVEGQPKEVEGQPKEVEGQPKEVEGQPKEVEGQSKEVEGQSKETEGQPKEVEGQPKEVEGQPKESQGQINDKKEINLFGNIILLENPESITDISLPGHIKALEEFGLNSEEISFEEKKKILISLYKYGCNTDQPLALSSGCQPIRNIVEKLSFKLLGQLATNSLENKLPFKLEKKDNSIDISISIPKGRISNISKDDTKDDKISSINNNNSEKDIESVMNTSNTESVKTQELIENTKNSDINMFKLMNELSLKKERKNSFNSVIDISPDGWCIYRAMLLGLKEKNNNSSDEQENEQIKDLVGKIQKFLNDNLNNKFKFIQSIDKITLKQYILDEVEKGYTLKNGSVINTVDKYIENLGKYVNDDFSNGPLIWGDAYISGLAFALINNVMLNVFEQCHDDDSNYCLIYTSESNHDIKPSREINILYINANHYNLLKKNAKANRNTKSNISINKESETKNSEIEEPEIKLNKPIEPQNDYFKKNNNSRVRKNATANMIPELDEVKEPETKESEIEEPEIKLNKPIEPQNDYFKKNNNSRVRKNATANMIPELDEVKESETKESEIEEPEIKLNKPIEPQNDYFKKNNNSIKNKKKNNNKNNMTKKNTTSNINNMSVFSNNSSTKNTTSSTKSRSTVKKSKKQKTFEKGRRRSMKGRRGSRKGRIIKNANDIL
jgi:hypothetical protein